MVMCGHGSRHPVCRLLQTAGVANLGQHIHVTPMSNCSAALWPHPVTDLSADNELGQCSCLPAVVTTSLSTTVVMEI